MYVYYQNFIYCSDWPNHYNRSMYTHQITVHENQSPEQYEALRIKFHQHKVSYSKWTKKVYIRVLARRVKVNKTHKSHPFYGKMTTTHWAEVRNYLLNINYRIDYDEDGTKIISNVLD
ncbi:hypothetical protein Fifi44_00015 [Erwinia phage Fifi44]|uniref:Uncharacterized protein n=1 Tax=Erwinia phage Fifi44 TaxID=2876597 RepID=A0AAE8Y195_9CAUD|nr:hypothetical protein QNG95_gp15 [Erwinia phage Fifi44]UCR74884.1 hypothetical protein Fifi44_00015 [Erwinia phage Fifi44]UCR80882.1 hypothetical protein Fifi451_00062 [Erwinia phage Fifi451]